MCAFLADAPWAKGNQVNIPGPGCGFMLLLGGNANEPRDVGVGPGKSFLFFLTT